MGVGFMSTNEYFPLTGVDGSVGEDLYVKVR
jgi:hypothetical protein